jgi:hypothetical protein
VRRRSGRRQARRTGALFNYVSGRQWQAEKKSLEKRDLNAFSIKDAKDADAKFKV